MKTIRSFEWVTPVYTGGNIYVYTGKLKNGNWFITGDCWCWLDEIDANPDDYDGDEVWQNNWIEEHSVKSYEANEAKQFYKAMYRWIIKNKPQNNNTNYYLFEIEDRLVDIDKWFPDKY